MAVTLPKPSITDIVDDKGSVTGSVDAGSRTDDTVLVLKGKARAGTTVEVFDGDTSLGSAKADKSGNWTFTTAELDQGGHAFKVIASNAKGDTSPASTVYRITVDTDAPAAPVFTVRDDAGRLVGDITADTRTDDASPTLSGKTEARATVEVFDGRKSLGTVTANSKGVWSYVAEDLKDGLHTLRAVATDTAGNSGDAHTFRLTVDTKPPKAPTLASVTDNTGTIKGSVPDNGSTNDKTPTLAGNAPAGAVVELFDADRSLGTTTAGKNGAWKFTAPELADGSHALTAVTVDTLGTYSVASNAITINLDTLPPEPPAIASVNDNVGKVKGNVADGKTTDDTTLVLKGVVDVGSEVTLYDYDTRIGVVNADGKGQWSFTTDELDNGSVHVFTARVRDAVGNLSDAGTSRSVTIATGEADTVAPFAPSVDTVTDDAGEVTGPVKNKGQSDDATLTLSGTAEANSTVEVFDDGDSLGAVKADKTGTWVFTTDALSDGKHVFSATATDAAKNVSDISSTFTVNVDAAAPAAPVIGSANDDAGRIKGDLASGQATDDTQPVFKGTAEPGSRVELFDAGISLGTVKAGKAGGWTFTPADELKDGGHSFTATATDSAGNTSPASAALTLTVDTRLPKTPDITRVGDNVGRVKGALDSGSTTDDTILSLTGKAGGNSTVEIFDGSLSLGSVTAKASGAWSFETPVLTEGNHSLTAVASNAVGSLSLASDTFEVTIRTQPPLAPVISTVQDDVGKTRGPVANNGKTDDTTPTLSGTATAGVTVEVLDYDTRLASVIADKDGQWTYTTETLENGSIHVFSARAVDDSGLVSDAGNSYTLTINTGEKDTTPPFAPTIDEVIDDQEPNTGSVSNKGKSNDATLTLSGTAEANSTVEIFDGKSSLGTVKADKDGDWTFTTPTLTNGPHGFTATATDAAKNASEASKSYTVTTDATAPTLDLSSDKASLKAGETAAVTFSFSEAPTGFDASDVTVTGGALSGLKAGTDAKVYTGVFTPTTNTNSLTASISVAAGSYTDAFGNVGGAGSAVSIKADTLAPTLDLSSDKANLKAGETAAVTFSFSEAPTGFDASDVTVTGGALSGLKAGTDAKVYTGVFTPTTNTNSLTANISVAAGSYTDAFGNAGGAGSAVSLKADTLAPTLSLSSDKANLKAGETAAVTFSFSEAPTGFDASDVTVSGGSLSGLKAGTDGKTYTATYTPTDKTNSLTASISVAAGSYTDAAGNAGGAGSAVSIKADTLAPTLGISSDKANLKAGETAAVTFSFSEAPTGFDASDVTVTGGALSGLKAGTDSKTYTALFTPTTNTNSLTASISVAAGSYTDAAGNAGGAGSAVSIKADTLAPTLSLSSDKASLKAGETAAVTFSFSEAPTGFDASDVTVSGGALSGLKAGTDGKTYTATYTPTDKTNSLTANISVAAGSYTDAAGNAGGAGSAVSIKADTLAPTLSLSSDKASLKAGETAAVTFSFSEAPTGFDASDVAVSGGALSGLKAGTDSKTYTALFTPTDKTNSLTGSVSVAAGSYTDAAGNAGGAGSAVSIKADTLAPGVTVSTDKTSLKMGDTALITFTFTEPVTGFELQDINASAAALTVSGFKSVDSKTYTAVYTPLADSNNGSASIGVQAGVYTDTVGNSGKASENILQLQYDTKPPTLSISSDKASLKAGETAAVTFSFSEAPTGFDASDLTVSGGTLSNFKAGTDSKTYTATYTPTAASGTLSVAAGSYTDAAGNNGTASNSLAITANLQVPTLTISSDKTTLKAGETAALSFTFSEAPTGFALEDIAAGKGTVSGLKVDATNSKLYTAVYTPEASNSLAATVSVAAGSYTGATGTAGLASNSLTLTGDTQAPSLTVSSSKTSFKAGETATVSFSFSEAPTGFEAGDITASGGTLSGLAVSGTDSKLYTALFTPTANTNSLTGAISVAAASYTDAVGNQGTASNSLTLTGDTKAPGLSIAVSSNTLTLTFDEAPVGFDLSDITTSVGSVGSLSGSGLTRTASFSPPSNASGTATFSVASGSYTDAAGNAGGAGSASAGYNTVVNETPPSPPPSPPTSLTGKVIDGYIKEATIFRDADGDGVFDGGEVYATTDSLGGYTLTGGSGPLVASGGTDISTNLPFIGVLKAPAGSTVVTPLTTLVTAIQAATPSLTLAQAQSKVATALGLGSTGVNFTSFDPIANSTGANSTVALQVQKAAIQVSNIIVQATKAVQGANTGIDTASEIANVASKVAETIASTINAATTTVDLANSATLTTVLATTATTLSNSGLLTGNSLTTFTTTTSNIATVMANTNTVVQTTVITGDATAALTNLTKAQVASQDIVAAAIQTAVSGGDTGGLAATYSSAAITTAASTAQVGIIDTTNVGLNETINAGGSKTATSQADIFTLRSGEYTYSISGFGNGDKLIFFNGAILNVIPDASDADGSQSLTATDPLSGATTTLNLTGLTSAQDAGIFNIPSLEAMFTGDTVTIGSTTTAVSANGSISATPAADVFTIAAGNYTYTIDGFTSGDQLRFFPGAILNVVPDSNQTDGSQQLTATDPIAGGITTVVLTGLTTDQDAGIFNVSSFNGVFGNGAIA